MLIQQVNPFPYPEGAKWLVGAVDQQIKGFQLYFHVFSAGNDRRGKAIVAGDMCAAWPTAAFSRVSDHFTTVFNALSNCT